MMTYLWPYLQRPENCQCQACQAERARLDRERLIQALENWPRQNVPLPGTVIYFGKAA